MCFGTFRNATGAEKNTTDGKLLGDFYRDMEMSTHHPRERSIPGLLGLREVSKTNL